MGRNECDLPTMEDVQKCLSLQDFDKAPFFQNSTSSFRNALEGFEKPDGTLYILVVSLHNLIHSVLNGTGTLPHSAVNDPVYVVFHSLTDAIFDEWMKQFHPVPICHNQMSWGTFFPPITNEEMFLSKEDFGYTLIVLVLLLVLFQHRRHRKGFEPLMNTRFNNKKYTKDP
uniref:L-dopachrome tautomerase n=1 Tax=Anolis carolinensis TaxID=28377 RepID=A0A803TR56_ANOCA